MSYTDQTRGPSPASMAAVIGVHAAIGASLVAGLTVSGTVPDTDADTHLTLPTIDAVEAIVAPVDFKKTTNSPHSLPIPLHATPAL